MDPGPLPPQLRPVMDALARVLSKREPAIRAQVERLRAERPDARPEELARQLIQETRRRVATSGALSGAASIAPGFGTLIALGTATGQSLYALEQETELVMAVAMLFGHELEGSDDRLIEALVVVGLAGGAVRLRDDLLISGGQRITVEALRRLPAAFYERAGGGLLRRVLRRLAASSLARLAPLAVGMAAGAGFDWLTVTSLGRAAVRYYGPGGPAARAPNAPGAARVRGPLELGD